MCSLTGSCTDEKSCESDREFMYPGDSEKNKRKSERRGEKFSSKSSSYCSGSTLLVHFFWTWFRKKNTRHIFSDLLCLEVVYLSRIDRVGDMSENLMIIKELQGQPRVKEAIFLPPGLLTKWCLFHFWTFPKTNWDKTVQEKTKRCQNPDQVNSSSKSHCKAKSTMAAHPGAAVRALGGTAPSSFLPASNQSHLQGGVSPPGGWHERSLCLHSHPPSNEWFSPEESYWTWGREHTKPLLQPVTLAVSVWVSTGLAWGLVALCSISKASPKSVPALGSFCKWHRIYLGMPESLYQFQ